MPRDRRILLGVSVLVSLALHAALLYYSPNVLLLRPLPAKAYGADVVAVRLVDAAPRSIVEEVSAALDGATPALDILFPDPVFDAPQDRAPLARVDTGLDPLGAEPLEREHRLEPDGDVTRMVDADILAISADEARSHVEITRTLARVESTRILGDDEFPTVRGPVDMTQEEILMIDPLRPSLSTGPIGAPGESSEFSLDLAADRPELEPAPAGLPELPEEEWIARRPVMEQIANDSASQMMDELVQFEITTYVPPGEPTGYFRLRIVPRQDQTLSVLPKDVTFVIDASSSMQQRKLDLAARGLRQALGQLRPEDRFNVVLFRDTANFFQSESVLATEENRNAAIAFVSSIESRGSTDVYNAVRPVIETAPRPGHPGIVVVVTDGRPTAGLRNGQAIINALTEQNDFRNSIFTFGAGRTVDRYLLDLMAYMNKGEARYVEQIESMGQGLADFMAELNDPLLVNVDTVFGRIPTDRIYPRHIPDFYKSRAVTVYGQFDPEADSEFFVRMTGQAGADTKEVIFQADLATAPRGGADIARGWGFNKAYHLIGEMCRVGETPDLLADLNYVSRRYNIRTVYDD